MADVLTDRPQQRPEPGTKKDGDEENTEKKKRSFQNLMRHYL